MAAIADKKVKDMIKVLIESGDVKNEQEALEYYHACTNRKGRYVKPMYRIGGTVSRVINELKEAEKVS